MAKPKRNRPPTALPKGKITKADIEHKLRQVSGELEEGAEQGRRVGPWVVGAAAVIVVVYKLGFRLGSRRSTLLEIRRIPGSG